eukprot:215655-Amphidinium_carterae.1
MSTLNLWRRFLAAVRRQDHLQMQNLHQRLGCPTIASACMQQCTDGFCVCTPREKMEASVAATVKSLQATLKKSLRACRRQWFSDLCSTVDGHREANRSRLLHQTVKQICSKRRHKGSRLMDSTGSIVSDRQKVADAWLQHWKEHFSASACPVLSFTDRSSRVRCLADSADVPPDHPDTFVFTPGEVKHAILHAPRWKVVEKER